MMNELCLLPRGHDALPPHPRRRERQEDAEAAGVATRPGCLMPSPRWHQPWGLQEIVKIAQYYSTLMHVV